MRVCICVRVQRSMASTHLFFFFFNDTATTEIYTLSLHDALPILAEEVEHPGDGRSGIRQVGPQSIDGEQRRSEEHTSELQSQSNLVCRLLLEKKKLHFNVVVSPPHHSKRNRCRWSASHDTNTHAC